MKTIFLYRIRHAGSSVDSFSCDPIYCEEMSRQGNAVSCHIKRVIGYEL